MLVRQVIVSILIVFLVNVAFVATLTSMNEDGGLMGPLFDTKTTYAYFSDSETADGSIKGDFPIPFGCVFWANSRTGNNVLKITGGNHEFHGCLHSNRDLDLGGNDHVFHRTLRHAGQFKTNDNGHILHNGTVQVEAEDYPLQFPLSAYKPGSPRADDADSRGEYHFRSGSVTIGSANVEEGLWYVEGNVRFEPTDFVGSITIVATGVITYNPTGGEITGHTDTLLALTDRSGPNTIRAAPTDGTYTGVFFAINGEVSFAGQEATFAGQVIGDRITISSNNNIYTAQAPILWRAP